MNPSNDHNVSISPDVRPSSVTLERDISDITLREEQYPTNDLGEGGVKQGGSGEVIIDSGRRTDVHTQSIDESDLSRSKSKGSISISQSLESRKEREGGDFFPPPFSDPSSQQLRFC